MSAEPRDTRLKRLGIRSWRRGIREMDLLLGGWSDANLASLGPEELDLYESLLSENDHDLYGWITGRDAAPVQFGGLISRIAREASIGSRH